MDHNELSYKRELINTHEKRLRELEIKEAAFGINCPSEIRMEIRDIRDTLEGLRREVKNIRTLDRRDSTVRERRKVLVIDDDILWLSDLELLLVEWGYDVITSSTGIDGVRLATAESPDVVLLDLRLPDINGHNVLLQIVERRIPTRVIILSGLENISVSIFISSGACDYVGKEEGFDRLKLAIGRAIELTPTVDVITDNPLSIINPLLLKIDDMVIERQRSLTSQNENRHSDETFGGSENRITENICHMLLVAYRLRIIVSELRSDTLLNVINHSEFDDFSRHFEELNHAWSKIKRSLPDDIDVLLHELNNDHAPMTGWYGLYRRREKENKLEDPDRYFKNILNYQDRFIHHLDELPQLLLRNPLIRIAIETDVDGTSG